MPGPHPSGHPSRRRRRHAVPAALGVTGLALATLTGAAASSASAAPAPTAPAVARAPRPPVALVAAAASVVAEHPKDSSRASVNLGLNLVAGDQPVSVVVHRTNYAKAATGTLTVGRKKIALSSRLVGLTGLRGFLEVTVADARGKVISRRTTTYCPGGSGYYGQAVRARPDAPDSSPWPGGCADHPFAQGMIAGQQAGWLSPVPSELALPDGRYVVTARLGETWRALLGVPRAASRTSVKVTVRPGKDEGNDDGEPADPAAAAEKRHAQRLAQVQAVALASGHARPLGTAPRGAVARSVAAAQRPDLRALPSTDIHVVKGKNLEDDLPPALADHEYLVFASTVWNAGRSPLVVEGFRSPGQKYMTAYQYFYAGTRQLGYTKVGAMEFDPRSGHEHWHFKDFAEYNLLDAKQRLKVRSQKEAFCLAPTDAIDLTLPGAQWNPGSTGLSSACGGPSALALRETLDAGWGDTYSQYRPGQSFDITTLPNGTYYVEVLANPARRLIETTTANNRSLRKIVLGGKKGARTVTVPPYQGVRAS